MRALRRFVSRSLLVLLGVIGGLFCFFVCQDVFAGYPQYGTNVLTILGVAVIALIGGVAWIIDQGRLDADG